MGNLHKDRVCYILVIRIAIKDMKISYLSEDLRNVHRHGRDIEVSSHQVYSYDHFDISSHCHEVVFYLHRHLLRML